MRSEASLLQEVYEARTVDPAPGCPLTDVGPAAELQPEYAQVVGRVDIEEGRQQLNSSTLGLCLSRCLFEYRGCAHLAREKSIRARVQTDEVIASVEVCAEYDCSWWTLVEALKCLLQKGCREMW